ncbi:hypothetical protein EDB81DRAFT_847076 [Dactylonectria macrodidyma]|uniref:Uncharacterized protein n=1 Tax=Dactylonectria macrodidyma TaxID=307937 RepID=A0A9P9IKW9_9HYPO|nr:hypothetical protein EDB81DRAFT_847076 [Dactylonectria macrodidyma]
MIALPCSLRPRRRYGCSFSKFQFAKRMLNNRVWATYKPVQADPTLNAEKVSAGERKFVIILPVDDSSPDLCKVVSSAVALGYPAPVIVNWKKDFDTDADGIGPSQLGKITGTLNYLQWVTSDNATEDDKLGEDDLVLMLDAHDIWLQLPPSVLLRRYFKINERANERLAEEHGFFDEGVMQQTIIVSAQKGCVAPRDSISDLHCKDVPESTLPTNVFGLFTDCKISKWKYMRPRFVNSGSFIGPAGDMRRYFQRVKDRMDQDLLEIGSNGELGGDQGIFAEVFGEQEVWRRQVREQVFAEDNAGKEAAISVRDEFEYHVGLDYMQELFYPTCYSERGGYFVPLDDAQAVEKESSRLGVSPPRIRGVPGDIREVKGPLANLIDGPGKDRSWGDVPLYVDFWTTSIPVAIHHNAWRDGLKSRRTTWWDKTWYFPYIRDLLEAHLQPNETAPLVWPYSSKGEPRASLLFWKNKESKDWELRATDFNTICKSNNETVEAESHWYDEVFRDGKGSVLA